MQKIIYIEKEIKDHKRVKKIVNKFNKPTIIYIDRYTEVFNKKNQNFRLQKINPSIILAKKYENFLLKTPSKYTIGKKNLGSKMAEISIALAKRSFQNCSNKKIF